MHACDVLTHRAGAVDSAVEGGSARVSGGDCEARRNHHAQRDKGTHRHFHGRAVVQMQSLSAAEIECVRNEEDGKDVSSMICARRRWDDITLLLK